MSQVDEIRAAADIVKIVGDYVRLRKAGANFVGLCPFHQEKTPSFAVHPVKQIFHCFGCGVGGDVFKFVMLIENLTFPEALRRLGEKVGIQVAERSSDAGDANARERAALYAMHDRAAKFFSAQLGTTAEGRAARAYLADRGLTDEVVAHFRLGYAPSEGRALARHLADAGFDPPIIEKSGLAVRGASGGLTDRFRCRVVFPIANEGGKVVAFGARALAGEEPKYLNSPENLIYTKGRTLYNLDRAAASIRKLGEAVLVEGYLDAIAVASAGVENVAASCGTSLTPSQARLLARCAKRVVVNYDPDSAGVAATERSLGLLLDEGFECRVLALPDGLDPDGFVRRRGPTAYRKQLSAAPAYLDYLTERAAAANDLTRPEGKVAAANAVLPHLVRVPSPLLRTELASRLAARLQIDERLLRGELRRAAEVRSPAVLQPIRTVPAEKHLLTAVLHNQQWVKEFLLPLVEEGATEGLVADRIFRRLVEMSRSGDTLELTRLEEQLNPDEIRLVYECQFSESPARGAAQLNDYCAALRRKRLERESHSLQAAIRQAAEASDSARLAELLHAKMKLDEALRAINRPSVEDEISHNRSDFFV